MNENIVELLTILENSYKAKFLEGVLEGSEYFEGTSLYGDYMDFKYKTENLLKKLRTHAIRNEMFESVDNIQELLDNCK